MLIALCRGWLGDIDGVGRWKGLFQPLRQGIVEPALFLAIRRAGFGGGNGARSGNVTSLDEYTHWQWLTVADTVPGYPF